MNTLPLGRRVQAACGRQAAPVVHIDMSGTRRFPTRRRADRLPRNADGLCSLHGWLPCALRPACCAAAWLLGCGVLPAVGQPEQSPPAGVYVATVELRRVQPVSWMPGTVISRNSVLLAAERKGRLEWVAEVGERFAAGEVVARLDSRDLRLEVEVAHAQVREVEARLAFYRSEVERLEQLAERNNAARNRLQEVVAMRDEWDGRLEAAGAQLGLAREGLRKVEIEAPFAGVVSERIRHPGEQVPESGAVVRLVDLERVEVSARVPTGGLGGVAEGDLLRVQHGGSETPGRLRVLVPVGDASRLFEIRVQLQGTDWPVGVPVRVAVPVAAARQALVVPRDALVIRSFGIHVFVVLEEGQVEMRPVEVRYGEQDWIAVDGSLRAGESVVIRGNERLAPGQVVRVLEP